MFDSKNTEVNVVTYNDPHYAAKNEYGWGVEMDDIYPVDMSNADHAGIFGTKMINFAAGGGGIIKSRVKDYRGKWLPYKNAFDINDPLGNDTPITGIEIVGEGLIYAVHIYGGMWLFPVNSSSVEGEVFAGNGSIIDGIWISKK